MTLGLLLAWPGTASAHAFLVSSNPSPGARVQAAPSNVTLTFNEAVDVATSKVTLTVQGKGGALVMALTGSGSTIRARVPTTESGIYEVAWLVTSADDGHVTQGTFAFGVGSTTGSIPGETSHSPGPNEIRVLANLLFFVGLALAAGGLGTGMLVDRSVTPRTAPIRSGLFLAIGGTLVAAADFLGFGTSAAPHRLVVLTAVAAVLLVCALVASNSSSVSWLPFAFVVAAAVSWVGLGHAASRDGVTGWAIATTHLVAAAIWVGALVQLVFHAIRIRDSAEDFWPVVRRYADLALWTVAILTASGLYLAVTLLPHLDSLWTSLYGQLLMSKAVLLIGAVSVALFAQHRGIHRRQSGAVRRATPFEAQIVVVVLIVSSLLVEVGPPAGGLAVANVLGAAPLYGSSLQQGGLAGSLTVGVAVDATQIQLQVYAGTTQEPGTSITARLHQTSGRGWQRLVLKSCGAGCATGPLALSAGASRLSVTTTAPRWTGGTLVTQLAWPPTPIDPGLLTQLVSTMRAVSILQVTEQVRSGRFHSSPKTFAFTGVQFMSTEVYVESRRNSDDFSTSARDVRRLPNGPHGLSFNLGQGHLWATLWLDSEGRIARERLVNAGNEVNRRFSYREAR